MRATELKMHSLALESRCTLAFHLLLCYYTFSLCNAMAPCSEDENQHHQEIKSDLAEYVSFADCFTHRFKAWCMRKMSAYFSFFYLLFLSRRVPLSLTDVIE